ncbi:MAG: prephenate dehydrogenase/arogenate dehydrogenase family protein [Clostridiales Family XIII bacterium]|nr:prephenate dehydrogenase/arogenate dehydrogenase family protein [Clostridiales Family XIII bacterium]
MDDKFENILVVGLGLIGGSLAAALKDLGGGAPFIYGCDAEGGARDAAVELGYADAAIAPGEAEALFAEGDIDLVVLAIPARFMREWFSLIADSGYCGVVTDVCSTKQGAVNLARSLLRYPGRFVPGHPMAGSEQSGIEAARPDLFSGAYWILTPIGDTDAEAYGGVHALLASVGARVISADPAEHDRMVAVVSHVPHVAAAALVTLAGDHAGKNGDLLRLAAGGFKDTTRVASGSADLWTGIIMDNSDVIAEELEEYGLIVAEFGRLVREGDAGALRDLLAGAAMVRDSLPAKWAPKPEALTVVRVPMDDRRGIVAQITAAAGRAGCNIEAIDIDHITEKRAELELVLTGEGDADGFIRELEASGFRPRRRALAPQT